MHRLLKLYKIPFQQVQPVSFSTLSYNPYRFRNCVLCKQNDKIYSKVLASAIRDRSTDTNPLILVSTRRRRKKPRSYAEILEVNDVSTTQTRASVKKLKASELSALVEDSDIDLDELHKIKTRSKFDNNNPIDPILTTFEENDFLEEKNLENLQNEDLETIPENSTISFKNRHHREKLGKEEALAKVLGAHVEMYIAIGQPYKALGALSYYRNRGKKQNQTMVKNINIYNTLLHGFASRGNIYKVKEVLKMLQEDNLHPNTQTYLSIFECLGRLKNVNRSKQFRLYFKQMSEQGITMDDILNEAHFVTDQREIVLSLFKQIFPEYVPKYKHPEVQYSCDLLKNLNVDSQLVPLDSNEKQSCDNNNDNKKRGDNFFSKEQLKKLTFEQLQIEMDGYVKVKSIENKGEPSEQVLKYRELFESVFKSWENVAQEAFERDIQILSAQPKSRTLTLEPYLKCLPKTDYVQIILNEVRRLAEGSETYSPTTNQLYRELGSRVYSRYQVQRKIKDGVLEKICNIQDCYTDWYARNNDTSCDLNTRQIWQWLAFKHIEGPSIDGANHHPWPTSTMVAIGEFLYKIIMHDLKINVNVTLTNTKKEKYLPAFYTIFRSQGHIVKEEVKPHPTLVKLFRMSEQEYLKFPAYEVPMKCPPKPWISVTSGGYLLAHADIIRLPAQAVQQWQRLTDAPKASLYPSLDSLNQLASAPWKVNQSILDVILQVFNSGGSSRLDVPQPPSACPLPPPLTPSMSKSERFQAFRQKLQIRRKRAEMYSLWCDALYRLSLANHFRNEIFWLPHNMDFRGRVYPIPPHLNHLGSDLARSMLVFARPKPLGEKGLDWLKIHCINLTGLKKRDSIEERLKYANEIIEDILDSADRPLTGKMWWSESDEPWQTLACCMEIANAIRSQNPAEYHSCFPVHQDGSCNGLQHYAALGRDSAGAYSVNLSPAETPQDVYSAVAALVETQRKKDASNGIQVAQTLEGFVKRKVIKQTVMTTVYGVTRYGARLQIARQLKDIDSFPKDMVWPASTYLTHKTFDSLRSMFTSTREIQDWFTECARLISAVNEQNVEWVTPLGLPVVQPYTRHRKVEQGKKMIPENFWMDMYEKPNVMKQKNAFPPNFIHSLDSSHMMLTSLYCERAGITFVSVHDCFWTHPCSVEKMNKICREQFVALHSEPILENLSQFLVKKYSINIKDLIDDGSVMDITRRKLNRIIQKLPEKGNFDLNSVLDSVYFFS